MILLVTAYIELNFKEHNENVIFEATRHLVSKRSLQRSVKLGVKMFVGFLAVISRGC